MIINIKNDYNFIEIDLLLELIGLEESLKMKEHKPKTSLTSSSDKRIIIEELQNLKEIDLDKFIKKVEEHYLSGQISKRDIIKELKI